MADDGGLWRLTRHICRVCLGRILVSADGGEHRCADCEASAPTCRSLCVCGTKIADRINAGMRCVENENPTIELPSKIVAAYVGARPAAGKGKSDGKKRAKVANRA